MNRVTKCASFLSFGLIAGMLIPNPVETNNIEHLNNFTNRTVDNVSYTNYLNINNKTEQTDQFVYLSDIPFITGGANHSSAYGAITNDKTTSDTDLSLRLNGSQVVFKKGVFAHAQSTVVYDISNYDYDYFTTYYGVSSYQNGRGSVKFYIYTSVDGINWQLETSENPNVLTSSSDAEFVKINIKGKNYLKLYADPWNGNGNDHALYGDAKLIKEGYSDNVTMTVEEYDKLIKEKYAKNEFDVDLEALILQRNLVFNVGNYQLKQFLEESSDNKEILEWLFNDINVLRYYVYGGKPDGTYLYSLEVLGKLYRTYKADLSNNNYTELGVKYSDLYLRMMVSLSLTHCSGVNLWVSYNGNSTDPIVRYQIFKDLYLDGKLENVIYENLNIEEMRWVMNNNIDDESIKWLNWYSKEVKNSSNPYSYITYRFGYDYFKDQYYSQENYAKWDEKYHLSEFGVSYGTAAKLWIVFEEGSVCGGLSKTGSNLLGVRGIPSAVIGQPGHAAYLSYSQDDQGRGYWSLGNDVFGWTQSEKGERMLNGWGSTNWDSNYQVSYILMAQAALNNIDAYNQAKEYVMLADSYTELAMKETLYNKAIEIQPINMDAWYGLITTYLDNNSKTEADYYNLALRLTESLKYYPLPMSDLLELFNSKFTSNEYKIKATLLKTKYLKLGTTVTDDDVIQSNVTRTMANHLLGNYEDSKIATFSFDGDDAGKLILSDRFTGSDVRWEYSLDGGIKWTPTSNKFVQLTEAELNSITTTNDIKVHLVGVDYSEENIYTLDIVQGTLPSDLYANDLENRLIGATETMEWRVKGTEKWTSYKTENPRFTGNVIIEHRVGATGNCLPSEIMETEFTDDAQPNSKKYIPIENLSVQEFSSEADSYGGHAANAIDGNLLTLWHSNYSGADSNKYIVIKLDKPRYISALEYLPRQTGTNGRIKDGKMYLSMDGLNWTEASSFTWENSSTAKETVLEESQLAQYVKLQAVSNYGDGRSFISAALINLFEDLDGERPRADLEYSISEPTTKSVTVYLVNPSTDIKITNNGGNNYHTFTENGQFTFEFVDSKGRKSSKTAVVNWIYDYEFFFDGKNPNTIILADKFNCDGLSWEYSIDGGITYKRQNSLSYTLTDAEISAMSADKDLKIKFIKANKAPEDVITIDILPSSGMPDTLYGNDLENKVIGMTDDMEWRIVGTNEWISYKDEKPDLVGNYSIEVRIAAHGTTLHSETQTFTFTHEAEDLHNKYVSVDNLKVVDYSSETVRPHMNQYEYATNAIDGNKNTMWHTDRVAVTDDRFIVLELNYPRFLTQVDVIGKENYEWGNIKQGVVYVSMDGVTWTQAATVSDPKLDTKEEVKKHNEKTFKFAEPIYAKYIKVQCTESHDYINGDLNGVPRDHFLNITMINVFEDTTLKEEETLVYVEYSAKGLTNQNVDAHVYSPNSKITILNNDGSDIHTFTENGEFTFEYVDEEGRTGKITAVVDMIDREAPTAELVFSESTLTKNNVTVSIIFNEEVIIENTGLSLLKDPSGNPMILFSNNGTINLIVSDLAGNKTIIPVTVSWIDKEELKVNITYSTTEATAGNVIAKINSNKKIKILNNDGKDYYIFTENGEFVFQYEDEHGKVGSIAADVHWITKTLPYVDVTYSETSLTNQDVTVTLNLEGKNLTVINNDGKDYYVFTENGIFTFEYIDEFNNKGTTSVIVDWIDKEAPTADIEFNINELTNMDVIATLVNPSEHITIIDVPDGSYIFKENGEYTFVFKDDAGNIGKATAKVNWIDKIAPEVKISYSVTEPTLGPVIVNITSDEEITILNNGGKTAYIFTYNGEFTFEYVDKLGNKGTATATVNWIKKESKPVEIEYSTTATTTGPVIVTLKNADNITVLNNGGKKSYIFTENGVFVFEYIDEYGNKCVITAKVDWIKENQNSNDNNSVNTNTNNNSNYDPSTDDMTDDNENINDNEVDNNNEQENPSITEQKPEDIATDTNKEDNSHNKVIIVLLTLTGIAIIGRFISALFSKHNEK